MKRSNSVYDEPQFHELENIKCDDVLAEPQFQLESDSPHLSIEDHIANEPFIHEMSLKNTFLDELKINQEKYTYSRFLIYIALLFASGIIAVLSVFLSAFIGFNIEGILGIIIFGPAIEEMAKQFANLILLKKFPSLIQSKLHILFLGGFSGLLFGVIENIIYGTVYLSDLPESEYIPLMIFRWFGCTSLHIVCATIASFAIWNAFQQGKNENTFPKIENHMLMIYVAVGIHSAWNCCAVIYGLITGN